MKGPLGKLALSRTLLDILLTVMAFLSSSEKKSNVLF